MSKAITNYVNRCKDILGLGHWTVTVGAGAPPDDSWADVEVSTNLYNAIIRCSPDLWKQKKDEIRRVVAHELIHLHQAGVERLVESLEESLGSAAYSILSHVWDVETERAADSLSVPLARLLPMPSIGED